MNVEDRSAVDAPPLLPAAGVTVTRADGAAPADRRFRLGILGVVVANLLILIYRDAFSDTRTLIIVGVLIVLLLPLVWWDKRQRAKPLKPVDMDLAHRKGIDVPNLNLFDIDLGSDVRQLIPRMGRRKLTRATLVLQPDGATVKTLTTFGTPHREHQLPWSTLRDVELRPHKGMGFATLHRTDGTSVTFAGARADAQDVIAAVLRTWGATERTSASDG